MDKINEAITLIADVIITHEGAFGMHFGNICFEARWKGDNNFAYAKKHEKDWSETDSLSVLDGLREYLKGKLNVEDEEPNGPTG